MANIIVFNNAPCLVHLPATKSFAKGRLVPGRNSLPEEYLAELGDNKAVEHKFTLGALSFEANAAAKAALALPGQAQGNFTQDDIVPARGETIRDNKLPAADEEDVSELAEYNVHETEALIVDENDLDTLKRWLRLEKRKTVKALLETRIIKLAP